MNSMHIHATLFDFSESQGVHNSSASPNPKTLSLHIILGLLRLLIHWSKKQPACLLSRALCQSFDLGGTFKRGRSLGSPGSSVSATTPGWHVRAMTHFTRLHLMHACGYVRMCHTAGLPKDVDTVRHSHHGTNHYLRPSSSATTPV